MPDDADIPIELSEKILAYVEREAGRDVLLSPEDEAMVRELLVKDPAVRALADDFRDVDTGLKAMFRAFDNIPVSEKLMQRIHAQNEAFEARERKSAADNVVRFKP
jgi:anti-sigma factor RsiW